MGKADTVVIEEVAPIMKKFGLYRWVGESVLSGQEKQVVGKADTAVTEEVAQGRVQIPITKTYTLIHTFLYLYISHILNHIEPLDKLRSTILFSSDISHPSYSASFLEKNHSSTGLHCTVMTLATLVGGTP